MSSMIDDNERLMTPENIRWHTFLRQLKGPEGINLHFDGAKAKWHCSHHSLRPLTRKILSQFEDIDVDATLKVFSRLKGKCDCEVVFSVEDAFWKQMGEGELFLDSTDNEKPQMEDQAVILLSGGMDSGVLLAWASERYREIHALSFDYGSKHAARELAMAEDLAHTYHARFIKVGLPFMDELFSSSLLKSGQPVPEGSYAEANMFSTVVPFRNGIMLSIAIGYAENLKIKTVLIAAHAGDHPVYPDCRQGFMEAMRQAAGAGTYTGVTVEAPFVGLTKAQIAELGRARGFDFSRTWSCYKGGDIHCGMCATCLERKAALKFAQGRDPTRYGA